jgi:hypothetical protein
MATLEQLLVQTRALSPTQLAVAQRDATMRKKRLAAVIVDLGLVDERRFAEWIAKVTQLPIVDPIPAGAVAQLQHRIAPAVARDFQILPVAIERDSITIAMMNPLDQACLDAVRTSTGLSVRPVIALYSALLELLNRTYPEQNADSTMLRRPPAEASNPIPPMPNPKADLSPLGSETLLAGVGRPFAKRPNDADAATTEVHAILPTPPTLEVPPPHESQLDRIERALLELHRAMEKLQRRVDAMDASIARVLSRK